MQQWFRTPFQIWQNDFTPLTHVTNLKFIFIYFVYAHMEIKEQLVGVSPLFPACGLQKLGPGYQSQQETPLLMVTSLKPSHALLHTSIPHLFWVSYNSSYRKKNILIHHQVSHYALCFFSLVKYTFVICVYIYSLFERKPIRSYCDSLTSLR